MRTAAKVGAVLLAALLLLAAGGYAYLDHDRPFAAVDVTGLVEVRSDQIEAVSGSSSLAAAETPGQGKRLKADGGRFADRLGRTALLRGINLGGSSKVPSAPPLPTHVAAGFFDGRQVSFTGRPFPLDEAEEHFARLRRWGFHFARLLVTWEAIEHEGPGVYDEAYLEHIRRIAQAAGRHGIDLFIDPHQDVFSRYCGGDGAPLWVFEGLGMDPRQFAATGAAVVHSAHGDPFPPMIWVSNYAKYAAATLFTLFFAGDDLAPATSIDGVPVQQYLQRHYLDALEQLALRLRDLPNVVGFGTMNEPGFGYVGVARLDSLFWPPMAGLAPTPLQGMLLAAGLPQAVARYESGLTGPKRAGDAAVNEARATVWREGFEPVWRQNGVWGLDAVGQPRLLRPDHFAVVDGRQVDFGRDYLKPFVDRVRTRLHAIDPHWLVFVEAPPQKPLPDWSGEVTGQLVHAVHWYDLFTLFAKWYSPILNGDVAKGRLLLGRTAIREAFARQLAQLEEETDVRLNGQPTLIGEVGIPFDLNGSEAYRSGDFSDQVAALDRCLAALEANRLSYALWNYTADNTNARGDQWNGEDLSIFSRDPVGRDQTEAGGFGMDSGGRALRAVIRPYPYRVAGRVLESRFDLARREYLLRFRPDPRLEAPTEVFVPQYHYGAGYVVSATGGTLQRDPDGDVLLYRPRDKAAEQTVLIRPAR